MPQTTIFHAIALKGVSVSVKRRPLKRVENMSINIDFGDSGHAPSGSYKTRLIHFFVYVAIVAL
jgi:hypothetical protein